MEYPVEVMEQFEADASSDLTLSGRVLFDAMSFVNDFKLGTELNWGRKCSWTSPYADALVFSDLDTAEHPYAATDVAENLVTYLDQRNKMSAVKVTGISPPVMKTEESAAYNLRSVSAITDVMINSFFELQKDPDYSGNLVSIVRWRAVFEALKERQEQE